MKTVLFSKKATPDPELLTLKAELLAAQGDLASAYRQFNQAVDPELVESCVYQISAVKARCNYLIRAIKERSPETAAAVQIEGNPHGPESKNHRRHFGRLFPHRPAAGV